ncbi:MAG: hypothetical protein JNK16_12685 [Phycisphaerales bacterium]|nr:hypothetical protein [Phycisphaerales bacterium]
MEKTLKSAAKVARRRLVADFLARLGVLALAGSVLACALVLAAKLAWIPPMPWWGFAALAVVATVAASILAYRGKWSPERSARELDRSLGLNNTLGSALELRASSRETEQPFIAELAARAEHLAGSAHPSRAVHVRIGPVWYIWPVLAAIAFACFAWIPDRSFRAEALAKKRAQENKEAVAEIRAIAKSVQESPTTASPDQPENPLDQKFSEIEEELAAGRLTAHDARVRTAEELSKRAESTETKARQTEATVEEARRALARAAARSRQASSPEAARLSEALRKGDLESAAAELERLSKSSGTAEREQAAKELDNLAKNLSSDPKADSPETSTPADSAPQSGEQPNPKSESEQLRDAAEQAAKDLRQPPAAQQPPSQSQTPKPNETDTRQGNPKTPDQQKDQPKDQPKNPREQPNPAQSPKPSEQQQPDPSKPPGSQDASKPSGEPKPQGGSEKQEQSKPSEQSKQPDQSKQGDQPSPSEQPGQQPAPQQPGQQQPSQQQPGQQQDKGSEKKNAPAQGAPQEQAPGQQRPQPGEKPSEKPNQKPDEKPGDKGQDSKSAERQPQQQPGTRPSEQSGSQSPKESGKPEQQQNQPGADKGSQQPSGSQPQPTDQSVTRQQQPGQSQSGQSNPRPDAGPSGGAQKLAQDLRNLSRQRENAQQQRETARGMRDRAEQMLENASPEERARLQELAKRLADSNRAAPRNTPAPWRGPTQTFDARPDPNSTPLDDRRPAERTIAEWLSEPKPGGTAPAGAVPQEPIRRASESANQAIEQQSIPPQYSDLVRRVFKRYAESAQTPPPSPPPAQAPAGNSSAGEKK